MKRKKTIWSDETVMVESTELVVSEEESLQRQDFMK